MNILFDYTQIPKQIVGVGYQAYNLVKQFSEINHPHIFYVAVQDDDHSLDGFASEKIKLIKVKHKIFRNFFLRIVLEQVYFPYLILKHKINLIHSLHYSFPLVRFTAKRVVTIHDMTFFLYPELHLKVKLVYFKFFIRLAARLKTKLICVSEATRHDLIEITKVNPGKCVVIHVGISEIFHPSIDKSVIEDTKNKYHIKSGYFLFIGTIEPRKNIKTLIKAFYEFQKLNNNTVLVIVGKKGWHYEEVFEMVSALHLSDKIIFTGYIEEDEKPILLNGCDIFIYPSIYEGFGLPVLEAMGCGVPVITSNVSSMPEIVENAAVLLKPTDDTGLSNSMVELILNKELRNRLISDGLIQAQKYKWPITAQKTLQCYEDYYRSH